MERVRIAQFADPEVAALAADFLEERGLDAVSLDQSGKGSTTGSVLVARNEAQLAYAMLRRVSKGEFAEGVPGESEMTSQLAIDLTRALCGTGYRGANPAWVDLLPILLIVAVLLLFPLILMLIRILVVGASG
jgi:hypothetical protein